jgi:hypothetical protein
MLHKFAYMSQYTDIRVMIQFFSVVCKTRVAITKLLRHIPLRSALPVASDYKLLQRTYLITVSLNTKRRGRVVNIPALYSGGPGFKSRPGHWLY